MLTTGETVRGLEEMTSESGESYVRCKHGWVPTHQWDGTQLLRERAAFDARRLVSSPVHHQSPVVDECLSP